MQSQFNVQYRKEKLRLLLKTVIKYEDKIIEALKKDFKKPAFESVITETSFVISELKYTIKNINKWAKPKMVLPSLLNFPSTDYIYFEPYGKVLLISPWNYPYQLAICPLIAAVAAGNSVVLKPSELTENTALILQKIIAEVFTKNHVSIELGGVEVSQNLLAKRWDYIFFTGSVAVGKIVAKAAAQNLTPVTLELGGKNPCIVDKTADIKLAAKRIIWGKIINAGQTCIAPDYILVDKNVKSILVENLIIEIKNALGENPENSYDFARIINLKNWERQISLLENQKILYGGNYNLNDFYLSPTLLDEPTMESAVMKDEIFGPILPIISFSKETEIDTIISKFEKPLAAYLFSSDKKNIKHFLSKYSFGGGCINDTLIHFANHRLPFGGVGNSGIGAYHGKLSFAIFSHKKAIVKKATWLDIKLRYAPYKNKFELIKKMLNWL
jgi:aldehyde dehydrogenase (NAD+)